jgi:hypothetical protein
MKLPWLLGWAWLLARCATADAELVFSTIAQPGVVLPGSVAGEIYTASSVDQSHAWGNSKVYFWAKATSSLAIAGTREGIWSWQNGAYALELLEGDSVSGGGGGLKVGKFDANDPAAVISNFTINPSGALLVSVRLRGGNTNANTDRGVIYHKAGANTLLQRSGVAGANFYTGVSLLADGAAYMMTTSNNGISQAFLFRGLPVQGLPSISFVASEGGAVGGEAGATYNTLGKPMQATDGSIAFIADVKTAGGAVEHRLGEYSGGNPSFPCATGTALAGSGGALTLGDLTSLQPAVGGGWYFSGSLQAGGANLGVVVPMLFRNGSLSSLFTGLSLADLYGEDGVSTDVPLLGGGPGGDLAMMSLFRPTNGGFRAAILRRNTDGAYKLILEDGKVAYVEGVAHAVSLFNLSPQSFTGEGALAIPVVFDGQSRVIIMARETTAPPTIRIGSPRRHRTTERRITLRGTASDDGTVTQVRYRVNGTATRVAQGTTQWNFTTPRLREGRNRVVVQAIDGDGGLSAPAPFLVRYTPR